jgi:hypothetical protein
MTDRAREILDSLSEDERQELFNTLLIEHFAAGEREVRVQDDEGILYGFLTTPGIHSCYQLGIDPKDMPPELEGPYYPVGQILAELERMAPSTAPAEPAATRP